MSDTHTLSQQILASFHSIVGGALSQNRVFWGV